MTRRLAWWPLLLGLASCSHATPAPVFPRFPHELFDAPIEITGAFGDHRNTHFHAGLDLSTGGVVGRPVHAPIDGDVVRVRASGVGYGRSLYLESADGRLLVFGHLDAFAEPVASFVYAVQDSSGQYEQDLWPARGRFRVRAGEVIGWTGRSGTGTPHLHVEVRRGDMAINPLLAGFAAVDTLAPRIERVTVLPVREAPHAARVRTVAFDARDTIDVTIPYECSGCQPRDDWSLPVRLMVEAVDAGSAGRYDVAPWRVRIDDGSGWVECRFDSVSWATDMPQSAHVYDEGRFTGHGATTLLMQVADGFRPRVLSASRTSSAGIFLLEGVDRPHVVTIEAEDLAGHVTRRVVRIAAHGTVPRPRFTSRDSVYASREAASTLDVPGLARIDVPADAAFEPTWIHVDTRRPPASAGELVPAGAAAFVGAPFHTLTLGAPATVGLVAPPRTRGSASLGLYRRSGDGWELVGNRFERGVVSGTTRRLGTFALFRDARAPRVAMLAPASRDTTRGYSTWALRVRLDEQGSGVDARATYFLVDGRRVPCEWDDVVSTLRWTPLAPPAAGSHRFSVIAVDRAGNTRKVDGRFVVR